MTMMAELRYDRLKNHNKDKSSRKCNEETSTHWVLANS